VAPLKIVTDKLASYSAAKKELMPSVEHSIVQYEKNRCELSEQPTRQQQSRWNDSNSMVKLNGFWVVMGLVDIYCKLSIIVFSVLVHL